MSATDDAMRPVNDARPPVAWPRVAAALLVGAFLGAAFVGALAERLAPDRNPRYEARVRWQGPAPEAAEWPRPALPGERAVPLRAAGRTLLAVRSFSAVGTEGLARDLQRRRLSGADAAASRRAAVRAGWRAALATAAPVPLPAAGRCAALVRARLLLVALVDPQATPVAPPPSPAVTSAAVRLARVEGEVARLALAARPDSLAGALTACATAEAAWLRAVAAAPADDPRRRLESAWRWHEHSRAPVLDHVERTIELGLPPAARDAVPAAAWALAIELERLAPDPAAVVFVSGAWGPGARAHPIAGTWTALLLAGALAGAGLGLALAAPWLRRRGGRHSGRLVRGVPASLSPYAFEDSLVRLAREPCRAWESELGWLHLLSGPDRRRVALGAAALAGGFLERGERVLLVDAGDRSRLHEHFGGDTRWGLTECLAGELPLLGAVQAAGRPGFFFLARGFARRAPWEGLSALLADARAHFGRVILALDAGAPRTAALPLGGRVLEAWWTEPGPRLPRRGRALSERIGIPFACFDLSRLPQATLEVGNGPVMAASGPSPASADVTPPPPAFAGAEAPALADRMIEVAGPPAVAASRCDTVEAPARAAPAPAAPLVLGCDPEVRERLRFLVWMQRMRTGRRSPALGTRAGA